MASLGPFKVGYPVIFRAGGDTTRVAFGKHIQEIERIYGILNALDADKLSASDLDGKLANFKPNLSFDDITGNLDLSRTTGNLDGSRITGKIDASKVYGKLSNANIDANNVNGLRTLIQSLVPSSNGNGDGITDIDAEENGYAVFANGFMIQWGIAAYVDGNVQKVSFPKSFPNQCLNLFLSVSTRGIQLMDGSYSDDANVVTVKPIDSRTSKSEFYFGWNIDWQATSGTQHKEYLKMRYLALGY